MVYYESSRFNKDSHFIKKAEKVKMKLDCEIKAHNMGQGKDGTIPQLKKIYKDIELMIEFKGHIPSYLIMITDSWDFNSELGRQLLDLVVLYKKL